MFSRLKKKIAEEEGIDEGALAKKAFSPGGVGAGKHTDESGGLRSHGGSSSNLSSRGSSGSLPGLPPNKVGVAAYNVIRIIFCSLPNWRTLHISANRHQNNLYDRAHLLLQVCITHILRVCTLCAQPRNAHTLTHTGLLWRVDKYEPHNFPQFGNEHSTC